MPSVLSHPVSLGNLRTKKPSIVLRDSSQEGSKMSPIEGIAKGTSHTWCLYGEQRQQKPRQRQAIWDTEDPSGIPFSECWQAAQRQLCKLPESSRGLQNSINYMLTSPLSGQRQEQRLPKKGFSASLMKQSP